MHSFCILAWFNNNRYNQKLFKQKSEFGMERDGIFTMTYLTVGTIQIKLLLLLYFTSGVSSKGQQTDAVGSKRYVMNTEQ